MLRGNYQGNASWAGCGIVLFILLCVFLWSVFRGDTMTAKLGKRGIAAAILFFAFFFGVVIAQISTHPW